MRPPIEETRRLLKASNDYLAERTPANERAFFQALEALETAEQERSRPTLLPLVRHNLLALGAAAIAIFLVGLLFVNQIGPALFLQAPTPTLLVPTPTGAIATPSLTAQSACPAGMVYVPQGAFMMGASPQDTAAQADEKPQRSVVLDAYCIDRTEVSNAQYAEFLKATNHTAPRDWNGSEYPKNINQNFGDLPVVDVSWFDARDYCTWQRNHLPTEAQWEKAARGTDGRIFPWGNTFVSPNANSGQTTPRGLQPVDSNATGQSRYGALNMAGNVAEWVADWYLPDAYTRMPDLNPQGPEDSAVGNRVVRGGSYNDAPQNLRVSARVGVFPPVTVLPNVGFRCAR